MNDNYVEKLKSVLQAAEIHSLSSFSWFSEKEAILPPKLKRVLPPETLRAHFVNTLQLTLYTNFYSNGFAAPLQSKVTQSALISAKATFVSELSKANSGKGYQADGWMVRSISDSNIIVHKNGLRFRVDQKVCLPPVGRPIRTGMSLGIRMPKEFNFLSPGFYVAMSDKVLFRDNDSPIVRFYWNLGPEGAVRFMHEVTSAFNQAKLAFRLKMMDHPARFTRCDSVIFYTNKSNYASAREIFEKTHPKFVPYLKNETPVFTKPISFGLGLAEDPPLGTSFGLHRCQLLAEGMVRAYEQGKKSLDERLEMVIDCFAEKKIRVEKPYLNPGSDDNYNFYPQADAIKRIRTESGKGNNNAANHQMFLRTAFEIGEILTRRALWHEKRCNWMGMDLYGTNSSTNNASDLAYKALGPSVYSGTSGVALFLAELQTAVDEKEIRRTSIGAIKQAISLAPKVIDSGRIGIYTGLLGIALATAYIGILLGEEELRDEAAELLHNAIQNNQEEKDLDMISGNAGAIVALLALHDILDNSSLLDFAVRLGDELLQKADKQEDQYSWKSGHFPKQRNLAGFSHGTAGIGYALLELFRATGDLNYRKVAELAFNYERNWFDEKMGNWPDFRGVPVQAKQGRHHLNFPVFWCHGAPGIALSRLHAYKTLKDGKYKSEALTALKTTEKWTEDMLNRGAENFSLCHGLAGNAEILFDGSQLLRQEFTNGLELAKEVAIAGVNRYAQRNHQWPFGMLGSKSPSLMLGLSGVGYFYLRLYDPVIPSLLIFEPEKILHRLNCPNNQ